LGDGRADYLLRRVHPVVAAVTSALVGFALMVAITTAMGVLLLEVVLDGDVRRADEGVNRWFADGRTPTWTAVSWVGSHLAETATVVAAIALITLALLVRGHVPPAVFLVTAIVVEALTYLVTVQFVDRHRPAVQRLEALGPGASYPSGHTAAAVVLYGGVAMLAVVLGARPGVRRALLALAIVAPLAVAIARVYRGMHHPLDVLFGAAMGGGGLAVGVLVAWCLSRSCALHRAAARGHSR